MGLQGQIHSYKQHMISSLFLDQQTATSQHLNILTQRFTIKRPTACPVISKPRAYVNHRQVGFTSSVCMVGTSL